jgi:2-amino-4-hydroxy-6-hydroxymethyldihydropteridine diphosphokinase
LQAVKAIELDLGRRKTIDNGPRPIDLDLLTFGDLELDDQQNDLIIPHLRLHEREFVLRPLAESVGFDWLT